MSYLKIIAASTIGLIVGGGVGVIGSYFSAGFGMVPGVCVGGVLGGLTVGGIVAIKESCSNLCSLSCANGVNNLRDGMAKIAGFVATPFNYFGQAIEGFRERSNVIRQNKILAERRADESRRLISVADSFEQTEAAAQQEEIRNHETFEVAQNRTQQLVQRNIESGEKTAAILKLTQSVATDRDSIASEQERIEAWRRTVNARECRLLQSQQLAVVTHVNIDQGEQSAILNERTLLLRPD